MSITLPLDAGQPPGAPQVAKAATAVWNLFPPATLLTTFAFWPMWHHRPLLALGNEVHHPG